MCPLVTSRINRELSLRSRGRGFRKLRTTSKYDQNKVLCVSPSYLEEKEVCVNRVKTDTPNSEEKRGKFIHEKKVICFNIGTTRLGVIPQLELFLPWSKFSVFSGSRSCLLYPNTTHKCMSSLSGHRRPTCSLNEIHVFDRSSPVVLVYRVPTTRPVLLTLVDVYST